MQKEKRLYVIVRKNLSISKRAVQAGHAVAQYLIRYPNTEWTNGTLIYLSVPNEQQLNWWLGNTDNEWITFREPDLGNSITAIACVSSGEEFVELDLL